MSKEACIYQELLAFLRNNLTSLSVHEKLELNDAIKMQYVKNADLKS